MSLEFDIQELCEAARPQSCASDLYVDLDVAIDILCASHGCKYDAVSGMVRESGRCSFKVIKPVED